MSKNLEKPAPPPLPVLFQAASPLNIAPRSLGLVGYVNDHFRRKAEEKHARHVLEMTALQTDTVAHLAAIHKQAILFGHEIADRIDEIEQNKRQRAATSSQMEAEASKKNMEAQILYWEAKKIEMTVKGMEKENENGSER